MNLRLAGDHMETIIWLQQLSDGLSEVFKNSSDSQMLKNAWNDLN